jgi:hypothetical protein
VRVLKELIHKGYAPWGCAAHATHGLPKTHLAHVALAVAINVVQLTKWLRGEAAEQTRTSAFKQVMKQAA